MCVSVSLYVCVHVRLHVCACVSVRVYVFVCVWCVYVCVWGINTGDVEEGGSMCQLHICQGVGRQHPITKLQRVKSHPTLWLLSLLKTVVNQASLPSDLP